MATILKKLRRLQRLKLHGNKRNWKQERRNKSRQNPKSSFSLPIAKASQSTLVHLRLLEERQAIKQSRCAVTPGRMEHTSSLIQEGRRDVKFCRPDWR